MALRRDVDERKAEVEERKREAGELRSEVEERRCELEVKCVAVWCSGLHCVAACCSVLKEGRRAS